jgi:cellulose synthase/poly-beta-1,6-N-acetylglucosamine synthase-like glycosyltransferase
MMKILADLTGFFYLLVIMGLALYGLYDLLTTIVYLRTRAPLKPRRAIAPPKHWPNVTIQLPIFNEKYTVERLLAAVTHLDYPSDRLQIQVLDDSTDDTIDVARRLVDEYRRTGLNISWIHRVDRKGYKAGALDVGLHEATGELIGIFDADFVPGRDWLKKTVPLFQNRKLGCLQTRWGHTNRKYNSLTQAEAMGIDGHFIVEQTVRSSNDFFLNFNGTAGLWRRACIEDSGGWQWDTLTEDLDLSYRAQMRGWKIGYLPEVIVPAELPSQVEAFKKQQFRWAKGSFQVVRKILPQVLEQPELPWRVRVMAFLHLTGYLVHPLMLCLLLLTLPVGLLIPGAFKIFPVSILAGFGPPLLYLAAAAPHTPPLQERLKLLPLLVIMGFGISLSTSIAVVQGLFGKGGVFIRTPKLNLGNAPKQHRPIDRAYIPPVSRLVWAEIGLGFYALTTILMLYRHVGWGIVPWMTVYVIGYFYIAGLNLAQHGPGAGT